MLKLFINWEKHVNESLKKKKSKSFYEELLPLHQEKIAQLQHERLIHLLVMLFVAAFGFVSVFFTMILAEVWLGLLDLIFMILTLAYIFHYRNLENTTQRWYGLLDKIRDKIS